MRPYRHEFANDEKAGSPFRPELEIEPDSRRLNALARRRHFDAVSAAGRERGMSLCQGILMIGHTWRGEVRVDDANTGSGSDDDAENREHQHDEGDDRRSPEPKERGCEPLQQ